MDSAGPIAKRTAGRPSSATGAKFTFANGTIKAENVATRWLSLRRSRGYRDTYHRAHGEGPSA
jgi:hypothetical protein